jgi:hypothetical protein
VMFASGRLRVESSENGTYQTVAVVVVVTPASGRELRGMNLHRRLLIGSLNA